MKRLLLIGLLLLSGCNPAFAEDLERFKEIEKFKLTQIKTCKVVMDMSTDHEYLICYEEGAYGAIAIQELPYNWNKK